MNKKFLKFKNNSGFVLLYTVLIASIILAITIGITSISYQEVVLSSSAKEGNISFFAADTGAECALYADLKQNAFSVSPVAPMCSGVQNFVANGSLFNFEMNLNSGSNCAKVKVEKDVVLPNDLLGTRIESLGYNASCAAVLAQSSPRTVERAIRVTYGAATTPTTPITAPTASPSLPTLPSSAPLPSLPLPAVLPLGTQPPSAQ